MQPNMSYPVNQFSLPRPPMNNIRMSQRLPNLPQNMGQNVIRRMHPNDQQRLQQTISSNQKPGIGQKRKRRLGDKLLTKTVRQIIPESESYMELLEMEKKLDLVLMRKRLLLQETIKKPCKIKKKLRVMLSSTYKEGEGENAIPGWELKVEGNLLDKSGTSYMGNESKYRKKFSSFFKSLVIELDRDLYGPDNHLVEWHRSATTAETDGFQVKRPGDTNVRCTILLMLDHQPPQYKLDPRLARILGLHTGTRSQIFYALWNYIKVHRLQDAHEKDFINCDPYFEQVFGCTRMRFAEIPGRLIPLQQPPDPIVINHMITIDKNDPTKVSCYDIEVEVEDVYKSMVHNFLQNTQSNQELVAIDKRITDFVEQINSTKTSCEFYLEFSKDPQKFISKWLASQAKDLAIMNQVTPGHPEDERKADYYYGQWVNEAVMRYFYNRINIRRQELEHALGLNN